MKPSVVDFLFVVEVATAEISFNPFRPALLFCRNLLKLFYFTELLTTQKHLRKKKIISMDPQT